MAKPRIERSTTSTSPVASSAATMPGAASNMYESPTSAPRNGSSVVGWRRAGSAPGSRWTSAETVGGEVVGGVVAGRVGGGGVAEGALEAPADVDVAGCGAVVPRLAVTVVTVAPDGASAAA